jgi:Ca-activated chloride channel homolog
MMKSLVHFFAILAACSIIVSGCSQDDQPNSEKNKNETSKITEKSTDSKKATQDKPAAEDIVVEPLPSTYEELEKRPVGEYAEFSVSQHDKKTVIETFKGLPDISENPSQKELDHFYNELLKMVQKDYKGPEEAIRQLRFQAIGDPEMKDTRYQFKENLNVEIILDASGSMAQSVNGKAKMEAAKDSILKFVTQLPKDAKVGIRVYGHKGSNADADKQLSCSSSEIIYPISSYDEVKFKAALDKVQPTGWTPIGLALNEAKKDLSQFDGATNTNIVYLVSDGISTCEDNPVQAAKDLYNSNITPIVNVIGFDVDSKGQNQLKQIADATEGLYSNVTDENQLGEELKKLNDLTESWKEWKEQGLQSIDRKKTQNSLNIFSYITNEQVKCTDEETTIYLIMSVFWEEKLMDMDSLNYLQKKNKDYHDWIYSEIEKFNEELKALNEKSYTEAIKALEEKYKYPIKGVKK